MALGIKWTDRPFKFDFPVGLAPSIVERLRGTPARLEDRVRSMDPGVLLYRNGFSWSIQEQAGHLLDVEELFLARLDEYDAGAETLRPADMSGSKTFDAHHNDSDIGFILAGFRTVRKRLVARLDELDEVGFARSALHPRLEKQMRVCDMMLFQADHDDYHLALITHQLKHFSR